MQSWFQDDLAVNGMRLRYFRSGGVKPALVLVHGYTDNALYWQRTAEVLALDWDVVAYDARGHGQSQRAEGKFGNAERVGDLVGVISELGLQRPALVGHSMGAATVALAAAQHPGLARCIVLEDPAWFEPPAGETADETAQRLAGRENMLRDWRAYLGAIQSASREAGLERVKAYAPNWSPVDQALSLEARRQFEIELFQFYPMVEAPWRQVVARINCPILLLLGTDRERSAIITVEQAQEAERLWQQGQWTVIEGAGHSIRYDRFDAYLAAVQGFLQQHRP
jgi:N-formylmaleamate deformylase